MLDDFASDLLLSITAVVFVGTLGFLIWWTPSVSVLWIVYLVYTIASSLLLHLIIFLAEARLAENGRHLSKRFPKYLEYGYTVTVAASLLQIFIVSPRMADYVTWLNGDEQYLGNIIKRTAQFYLDHHCNGKSNQQHPSASNVVSSIMAAYFTTEYCNRLKPIIYTPDVAEYVIDKVINDPAFFLLMR